MRFSRSFINTSKESPRNAETISHKLMIQSGMIDQVSSGIYNFLPLGHKVLSRIESVIRQQLDDIGCLEISLPIVQPQELWVRSGRWDIYGQEMLKFKNRDENDFCLSPTHEEVVSSLVKNYLTSQRQLPIVLYQIGRKFRDEIRPRHGLLRTKEFMMKDAYSFDADRTGMDETYLNMRGCYERIFDRFSLEYHILDSNPGEIGGSGSEEFLAVSKAGEDKFILKDGRAKKIEDDEAVQGEVLTGIELGHIFKLEDRYSKVFDLSYMDSDGHSQLVMMGCYGIGNTRLLSAIIEQHNDARGMIWPKSIAPYDLSIIPVNDKDEYMAISEGVYDHLIHQGFDVLYDERKVGLGNKIKDSDLLGIPYKIIVGKNSASHKTVEIEERRTDKKSIVRIEEIIGYMSG